MIDDRSKMWNTKFAAPGYIYGKAPCRLIQTNRHLLPGEGKALAIADGEGRNGVFLAECGLDVLSVDFSLNAQMKARALASERGVRLKTERADLLAWDWPVGEFDVVAAIFIQFLTPDDRTTVFRAIRQALKPGGLLLLHGYRPEQIAYGTGGPSEVENLYTREILEESFGDFADLSISAYDCEIEEGTGHNGMSALIDLTGRRPVSAG